MGQDAGTFTLSRQSSVDDIPMHLALEANFEDICDTPHIPVDFLQQRPQSQFMTRKNIRTRNSIY